jgi:hypothetical protein
LRVGEERDPLGRGLEDHAVAGQAGADPQGDRNVRLAASSRSATTRTSSAGTATTAEATSPRSTHLICSCPTFERSTEGSGSHVHVPIAGDDRRSGTPEPPERGAPTLDLPTAPSRRPAGERRRWEHVGAAPA